MNPYLGYWRDSRSDGICRHVRASVGFSVNQRRHVEAVANGRPTWRVVTLGFLVESVPLFLGDFMFSIDLHRHHRRFCKNNRSSLERIMPAARAVVYVPQTPSESDFSRLSPIHLRSHCRGRDRPRHLHFGFKKTSVHLEHVSSWLIMAPVGLAAVFAGRHSGRLSA